MAANCSRLSPEFPALFVEFGDHGFQPRGSFHYGLDTVIQSWRAAIRMLSTFVLQEAEYLPFLV